MDNWSFFQNYTEQSDSIVTPVLGTVKIIVSKAAAEHNGLFVLSPKTKFPLSAFN